MHYARIIDSHGKVLEMSTKLYILTLIKEVIHTRVIRIETTIYNSKTQ